MKTADTTQNWVVSNYFDKIPIISLSDTVNYTIPELYDIDSYLEKNINIISEIGGVESSRTLFNLTKPEQRDLLRYT